MELAHFLENLGFDDKQAQVYLAALELGSATVQELADKSGIKRTSIYNFLDEMKGKGLISELKQDDRLLIVPASPHILLEQSRAHTREIERALPEMMSLFNLPGEKPKIRYYEGLAGIKKIYDDTLTADGIIYAYSDYEKMFDTMDNEYMWAYANERTRRGIKFLNIAKAGRFAKEVVKRDSKQLRQTKVVSDIEFDTEINIYNNKVAMISFRRPYACVIIEDRAIAQTHKSAWKLLWDRLTI